MRSIRLVMRDHSKGPRSFIIDFGLDAGDSEEGYRAALSMDRPTWEAMGKPAEVVVRVEE